MLKENPPRAEEYYPKKTWQRFENFSHADLEKLHSKEQMVQVFHFQPRDYMNFQLHLDNTPIIVLISLQLVIVSEFGSFVLSGFIMMCPQLFINYKLKSVAHLPWRQMTYKFLNTIIDDLFAFVIKMPTLHRLSVFRDGEKIMDQSLFLFILWNRRI